MNIEKQFRPTWPRLYMQSKMVIILIFLHTVFLCPQNITSCFTTITKTIFGYPLFKFVCGLRQLQKESKISIKLIASVKISPYRKRNFTACSYFYFNSISLCSNMRSVRNVIKNVSKCRKILFYIVFSSITQRN